jgi:dipeptidyl aminopeptidase/acylaminoacyl peptidase/chitodextrinase
MRSRPSPVSRGALAGVLTVIAATGCSDIPGPGNAAPVAGFTVACNALTCQLTDRSNDSDGTIEAYAWDFGDGTGRTEPNPVHTYAAPGGRFTVTLTVTDDDGEAATAAKPVIVESGNAAPVADLGVSCTNLTCGFTDLSTDPDAGDSVLSRAWDFGDGQHSSEQNPTHTYADPGGRFTVTLTVTDDDGAGATAVKQIDVAFGPPDWSGTYERETPHSAAGRHSRYVLRGDGTFELHDETVADTTIYSGRWESAYAGKPGHVIHFDFDGFQENSSCGPEGVGAFLLDGHMGIAYCGVMIQVGLEEGVYTSGRIPDTPGSPPPQAGQIAFVRDGLIYRVNTDGSGLVQLSAGGSPAWSSDGSRITFAGTAGIHIMDADGSNVVRRTTGGHSPTWAPDGEWIAFDCSDYGQDVMTLCKVRAADDGTTPVTIYQERGYAQDPAWSPDGTRIAFVTDWAGFDLFFDVWVMAPDGSQRAILRPHTSVGLLQQWEPAWSPDGSRIALVECPWAWRVCSSSVITVMNANGTGTIRLATTTGFAGPTWSPDGQVIAFASSNGIEWVSADGRQRGRIIADGHSPAWRP